MSALGENLYGDVLAAAPPVLAEAAIRQVHELLESRADSDDIAQVVTTAVALLNMHQRNRPGRKRAWLAKVTSFAFPRTFATAWGDTGERYVCFTGSITKGGKPAVGREIEVQMPVDDAERLGQQMLRMVEFQRGQTTQTSCPGQAQEQARPSKASRAEVDR
ncbi:hypothetical protein HY68_36755 [Streptomyces sp. AcH 505]|uniref:hypothetical protein n=1 Tax=Streptomyces sp. AcH 505 TaxID=352211 RepID=UPI000591D675|nr:hypothetical protein HY68_36755 [Streptomyces sp. AcH 505]